MNEVENYLQMCVSVYVESDMLFCVLYFKCLLCNRNSVCISLQKSVKVLFLISLFTIDVVSCVAIIVYLCLMSEKSGQSLIMCRYVCGVLQVGQSGEEPIFQIRKRYSLVGPCPVSSDVVACVCVNLRLFSWMCFTKGFVH